RPVAPRRPYLGHAQQHSDVARPARRPRRCNARGDPSPHPDRLRMTGSVAALPDDTAAQSAQWQRLHPATRALASARLGPRTLNFLPALAAIGIAGKWVYVLPAFGAFLLISLVTAWIAWARFRFLVGANEIVIESGILSRQHRTIPFDRIQDVSIEQGL